jgi:hypothetical protein
MLSFMLMKYLLLYIPLILLVMSYGYNRRYHRFIDNGRASEIVQANQRSKQFMNMAVFSFVVLLIALKLL